VIYASPQNLQTQIDLMINIKIFLKIPTNQLKLFLKKKIEHGEDEQQHLASLSWNFLLLQWLRPRYEY